MVVKQRVKQTSQKENGAPDPPQGGSTRILPQIRKQNRRAVLDPRRTKH